MDNIGGPVTIARPDSDESAAYYFRYIDQVSGLDALEGLQSQYFTTLNFLKSIPEDGWNYRYEDGKWSIKEVVGHLMDAERVFAYRALRVGRKDKTPLPGFDQDPYVPNSGHHDRTALSLIEEYKTVREATYSLFENLSEEALLEIGEASGSPISCRALAWIILGHEVHHIKVLSGALPIELLTTLI